MVLEGTGILICWNVYMYS